MSVCIRSLGQKSPAINILAMYLCTLYYSVLEFCLISSTKSFATFSNIISLRNVSMLVWKCATPNTVAFFFASYESPLFLHCIFCCVQLFFNSTYILCGGSCPHLIWRDSFVTILPAPTIAPLPMVTALQIVTLQRINTSYSILTSPKRNIPPL